MIQPVISTLFSGNKGNYVERNIAVLHEGKTERQNDSLVMHAYHRTVAEYGKWMWHSYSKQKSICWIANHIYTEYVDGNVRIL